MSISKFSESELMPLKSLSVKINTYCNGESVGTTEIKAYSDCTIRVNIETNELVDVIKELIARAEDDTVNYSLLEKARKLVFKAEHPSVNFELPTNGNAYDLLS